MQLIIKYRKRFGLLFMSTAAFKFKTESSSLNFTSGKLEESLLTCTKPLLFLKDLIYL